MTWTMHHGDALAHLAALPADSIDAVVTDTSCSEPGLFGGAT